MPLTFAGLIFAGNLGLKGISAVVLATIFVGIACWIFFECVKRTKITRFLFGIKELQEKLIIMILDQQTFCQKTMYQITIIMKLLN